jgi:tRNA A-37 threonylcarbamoyl transferase component Bud32
LLGLGLETGGSEGPGERDAAESSLDDQAVTQVAGPQAGAAAAARPGAYEILGELGKGGMGVVFKARQVGLDRVVALKRIRALAEADPAQRERFAVEARALARMQHPHIVQIFEVGEADGCPFFSMEYVPGGSLAERLKATGPLPPGEAARLVEALAGAVEAAHRAGVLHRDIKPANVLLSGADAAQSVPKLTDFGLAKYLDADEGMTHPGAFLGTPTFMAPEQAAGRNDRVGPRTDVYGLGATLYALLTGGPPFKGATSTATARLVVGAEPPAVRAVCPSVPADLEAVCLKCLEKEPGRRYASAAELADDLGRWRRGEPTHARPLRWPARLARRLRRQRGAVLAVAGLAAAVCLMAYLARRPAAPPEGPDPDAVLKEIARELAAGRPVVLIGPTGLPRWHRWKRGHTKLVVSRTAPNGACAFQADNTSVLELLPGLPGDCPYRVSAELRQDGALTQTGRDGQTYSVHGEVGLFAGCQDYPLAAGGYLSRGLLVRFSEQWKRGEQWPGKPHGHGWRVHDFITNWAQAEQGSAYAVPLGKKRFDPNGPPGPWRRLQVEWAPQGPRIRWTNAAGKADEIAPPGRDLRAGQRELEKFIARHVSDKTVRLVPLSAHGSLGVWADSCSISVRNVVVEPLSP